MNNTKTAIYESAIKIFSVNGYDGATMDDIAQNAGVAKGTLYYHFKSKEEIFSFIISEGLQKMKDKTLALIELESGGVNKLLTFCKIQLNIVNEYKDFFKVVMCQVWGENSRHMELRNAILSYTKEIEVYVNQAIKSGLIKNDDSFLLSCNILGAVFSMAIHSLIKKGEMTEEEELNKMMEYLLEGIKF